MAQTQRVRALRGFKDILPPDSGWWLRFQSVVERVMDAYGYQHIKLPLLESTELFKRTVGEVTDIVEKEMYTFIDRDKTSMSLRPEGTAGCVRAGIDHGLLHNQQQRLWYSGAMFRHERPQAGRYRQFEQIGVEAFGMQGPDIDLEVIALSARILGQLGLLSPDSGANLTLELNTMGTAQARAAYRGALVEYLSANRSALDENALRRLETNPLRVLDSKSPEMQAVIAGAPPLKDHLDAESVEHFDQLRQALDACGIAYHLNPRLVRGLDYYSRTVFEWTTDQLGAQGTVCGGGRYDGLVDLLGGGDVPGFGFGMGSDRVILLMQQCFGDQNPQTLAQVYLCVLGEELMAPASCLAESLRDRDAELGGPLRVVMNAGGGKLKAQLKRADRSGASVAVILGPDELAAGQVQIKPLRGEGSASVVALGDLPAQLGQPS